MRNSEYPVRASKGRIVFGIMLVLLGLLFLAYQLFPSLVITWFGGRFPWPLFIIVPGAFLLLTGLLTRTGGLVIPGTIVSGIGGLLYYQNFSNDWSSWAYAWALIPGFVGLGLLLASLIDPSTRTARRTGLYMFSISLAVFAIFSALFGGRMSASLIWPVLLILVGLGFLLGAFGKR
jgi:hypothetical protein